jgi:hypothetical protein
LLGPTLFRVGGFILRFVVGPQRGSDEESGQNGRGQNAIHEILGMTMEEISGRQDHYLQHTECRNAGKANEGLDDSFRSLIQP